MFRRSKQKCHVWRLPLVDTIIINTSEIRWYVCEFDHRQFKSLRNNASASITNSIRNRSQTATRKPKSSSVMCPPLFMRACGYLRCLKKIDIFRLLLPDGGNWSGTSLHTRIVQPRDCNRRRKRKNSARVPSLIGSKLAEISWVLGRLTE